MNYQRREHVFLVRMWTENVSSSQAWRGSIDHVASGCKLYVTGPGEVADFITLRLREAQEQDDTP